MTKLKLNIVSNGLGKIWSAVSALIFLPLYNKILGPETFGLVAFFLALQAAIQIFDFGLGVTINRELARYSVRDQTSDEIRDLSRTLELIYFAMGIFLGLIFIAGAGPIAEKWLRIQALHPNEVKVSVAMMGISIAFLWPCSFYLNGLMGLERQVLQNAISSMLNAIRGIGAILCLWLVTPTATVFFSWQIVFSFVQVITLGVCFWRCMPKASRRPRFSHIHLKQIWRFTAGIGATGILTFLLSQLDKVLLSRVLTLTAFGYYSFANQVNTASRLMPGSIYIAFFPRFSALVAHQNEARLREIYHQACQLVSLIVLPASITLALFSHELILVWTQDSAVADAAAPIATILCLGSALNSVMGIPYEITIARGWVSFGFYQNLISAIILTPVIIILVEKYGGIGAAIAWSTLNIGYFVISAPVIHAYAMRGDLRQWYLVDVGRPAVVSILLVGLGRLLTPETMPPLILLPYVGFIWAATFVVCCLLLPDMRLHMVGVLRWTGVMK